MARARARRSPPTRAPATPGRAERAPAGAAPRTRGTAPTGRPRSSGVSAPSVRRLRDEHHTPDNADQTPEVHRDGVGPARARPARPAAGHGAPDPPFGDHAPGDGAVPIARPRLDRGICRVQRRVAGLPARLFQPGGGPDAAGDGEAEAGEAETRSLARRLLERGEVVPDARRVRPYVALPHARL